MDEFPAAPSSAIMSERSSRAPSHLASNNRPQDGSSPSVPTRIILKLFVKDFDSNGYSWFHYPSAVGAYLNWAKRPLAEWKEKKHNVFVEPFQDIEVQQNKFHVIIDLLALSFEVKNMDEVNHEIYEIKRNREGEL